MKKVCSKCKIEKDSSEFYVRDKKKKRPQSFCKQCMHNYAKDWQNKNPHWQEDTSLRHHYGITLEVWLEMLIEQNGRCLICGKHQANIDKVFFIDHNHKTGKIRGLVCPRCNTYIGFIEKAKRFLAARSTREKWSLENFFEIVARAAT